MPILSVQVSFVLIIFATGISLGFLFDIYRVLTGFIGLKGILLNIGDLIFWLIISGLFFTVLLWLNEGEFRFYSLLFLSGGYVFYRRAVGGIIFSFMISSLDSVRCWMSRIKTNLVSGKLVGGIKRLIISGATKFFKEDGKK